MTVLDIGANMGYYSLEMSRLVGATDSVVNSEPQLSMVSELRETIRINALETIVICAVALSNEVGPKTFYIPVAGEEGMRSLNDTRRTEISSAVTVQCSTVDTASTELGIQRVDFVKMDVEGAELQVVEGEHRLFAGTARPVVVFEANEANCAAFGHCVFDLLRRFDKVGYSLIQLDNEDWCATSFSPAQRMIQGNEPYALCTGSWN